MDEDLISKKDLLTVTGISYGQLYRWKRKNIIPEDWFIKKSSYTGQETFFPRDKVMERIDKIKNMKDDLSLDDLAEKFSQKPSQVQLNEKELLDKNVIRKDTLDIYKTMHKEIAFYNFDTILYLTILERFLISGEISFDEGKNILSTLEVNYYKFKEGVCEIVFIRKFGVGICFLILIPGEVYFEETAKLVLKVNISKFIEELKLKLINREN